MTEKPDGMPSGFLAGGEAKGFVARGEAVQCAHSRRKALAHFWTEKCFFRGAEGELLRSSKRSPSGGCPRKKRIELFFRVPTRKTLRGLFFYRSLSAVRLFYRKD